MPVQYEGIKEEHLNVRANAGIFDVSHMGEVLTHGPEAEAFLQRVLSNDVSQIEVGGAQYSALCRENGGVLDDLFTYRTGPDTYLTVTNASNHEKDYAWMTEHAPGFDVEVEDAAADYAMIAFQGPQARVMLEDLIEGEQPERMHAVEAKIAGAELPRLRHRLHGRGRRRAAALAGRRRRRLGRAARRGRATGRTRRARHAPPRGLLPPLRQRSLRGSQPDRGWARLGVQARHGLHRSRGATRLRARADDQALRPHRPGHPPPGQRGDRGRR